jgi:hypothetical protein
MPSDAEPRKRNTAMPAPRFDSRGIERHPECAAISIQSSAQRQMRKMDCKKMREIINEKRESSNLRKTLKK